MVHCECEGRGDCTVNEKDVYYVRRQHSAQFSNRAQYYIEVEEVFRVLIRLSKELP